ncbi:hypothetical protein [Candidatus Methylomicrobium oryzae]|jgi:hypothetical protein|uniref:hypothetical protein n=1 Tax=Candidatus Methylomicrobium oryzae TaxID=2802053 RepID=UPI001921F77C|nr:hypothetical protein [Methylomicrobium sp. RS1]MBL1262804.1 hypothetical protein [Methylomicrobium sp. RS1]
MSFATDMPAQAQTAYANALKGKMTKFDGRWLEQHDIKVLRDEVAHWQAQVDAETARAAGTSVRKPIQVVL